MPCFEYLLNHLETLVERYRHREEDQLYRASVDLGWQKLNEYYTKLERSPVYVAALVLHPAYKFKVIERLWSSNPEWIDWARDGLQALWQQYKDKKIEQPQQSTALKDDDWLRDFMRSKDAADSASAFFNLLRPSTQDIDELDEYLTSRDRTHSLIENPVEFWHHNRTQWPRLAQMAIDIFSIPATEADNERTYSKLGDMITKKRYLLQSDIIGASQSLVQWDLDGAIDWR